jgi:hypothetical protein
MNLPTAPAQVSVNADSSHPTGTRLQGRWLVLARVVWLVLAVVALGLCVASIPSYFAFLHVLCTGTLALCRNNGQFTPNDLRVFQASGLSLDFLAIYQVALFIVFTGVFATVGIIVFWRKSDDRMALLASLALVMFPAAFNSSNLATLPSAWLVPSQFVVFLGDSAMFLFFYLFPDGRFVPHWTRWLSFGVIALWAVDSFFPALSSSIFISVAIFGFICSVLVAQVYRYRRVFSTVQRQQTRWVVFGISIGLGSFLILDLFWIFFPALVSQDPFGNLIIGTATYLVMLVIPLSIGVAILRSHLFDIDRIINRTLVYGSLTAVLALVYFGSIVALQLLVGVFTGHLSLASQPPLVLVASTLGIAALFQPLRRRIQALIDRQFYRSKYNATRTLAAFSETLRGELDLNQLSEQLLTVIHETMQPAHVSLWLRTPEQSRQRNTRLLPSIDEEERVVP